MADSPFGGHRLHTTREQAATVALGLAMAVSVIFTSRLATSWSWSYAMTLVVVMVGIAVYLSRPGIAIAAILLPFAVLDEGTPDVIPAVRSLSDHALRHLQAGLPRAARRPAGARRPGGGRLVPRGARPQPAAVRARDVGDDRDRRLPRRAGSIVGLYVLDIPGASVKGLRPFYDCVLAAFVVWRVLRSMPRARAERTILDASLVVGGILLAIAFLRVAGLAGTPVRIDGVSITFFDAASPYVLLCCTGIWAVALRRAAGHRAACGSCSACW